MLCKCFDLIYSSLGAFTLDKSFKTMVVDVKMN